LAAAFCGQQIGTRPASKKTASSGCGIAGCHIRWFSNIEFNFDAGTSFRNSGFFPTERRKPMTRMKTISAVVILSAIASPVFAQGAGAPGSRSHSTFYRSTISRPMRLLERLTSIGT
jgi:hypothetical protein